MQAFLGPDCIAAIGRMGQSPDDAPLLMLRAPPYPRPASSLPDFYQLDAKILHVLQGAV